MGTLTSTAADTDFNIASFIEEHLSSPDHNWSIGISGAIGEFMYDNDEQISIEKNGKQVNIITPRGAMQINTDTNIKCVAYEEPSPCTKSWSQSVAFCLSESDARGEKNNRLTELGPDKNAITASSRKKILFDMGVGSAYLQFCVRTDEAGLLEILRNNCGRSIFEEGNPASMAILEASPARVVISALGRIEIESKIPTTPEETHAGPHTHLLPALLNAQRKTHVELPDGYVEVLTLYPEHPVFDKYGQSRKFDVSAYDKFQTLLNEFASEDYCSEKNRIRKAMLNETKHNDIDHGDIPLQVLAYRVAKLQVPFLKQD